MAARGLRKSWTIELESRPIGLADEVVIALKGKPAKVKMCGHPTWDLVSLVHDDLVACLQCMICRGEPHSSRADDGDAFHDNLQSLIPMDSR